MPALIEAPPDPHEAEDKYNLNAMSREEVADFLVAKASLFVEHYRGADSCVEWAHEVQRAKVLHAARVSLTSHGLATCACPSSHAMRANRGAVRRGVAGNRRPSICNKRRSCGGWCSTRECRRATLPSPSRYGCIEPVLPKPSLPRSVQHRRALCQAIQRPPGILPPFDSVVVHMRRMTSPAPVERVLSCCGGAQLVKCLVNVDFRRSERIGKMHPVEARTRTLPAPRSNPTAGLG